MNPSLRNDDYELRRASPFGRISLDESIIMTDVIFWMCITDGLHSLQMFITFIPQVFTTSHVFGDSGCIVIGIFAMFLSIQSPLWHIILAYHLLYLLLGYSLQSLGKQKKYHFIIALFIPTIVTLIPIPLHEYGPWSPYKIPLSYNCYLTTDGWQFIQIALILFCTFIHYIVLLICCYKLIRLCDKRSFKTYLYNIITKYLRFVIVYTIVWTLPALAKIHQIKNKYNVPVWLNIALNCCIAFTGFANAIVWIWNLNSKYYTPDVINVNMKDKQETTFSTSKPTTNDTCSNDLSIKFTGI